MNRGKKRKYNELTIEKKKEVLDALSKGQSHRKIAEQFSISKSTVGNIADGSEKVLRLWNENCDGERKRKLRQTENERINIAMFEFFAKCRAANIPVSGPLLQTKALRVAESLNIDNFHASNGWLQSFLTRNNIQYCTLSGQSADADLQAATDWKSKLPEKTEGYELCDIFNGDEGAINYRQLLRKSYVAKDDPCKGGKLAKERLSVLFCCSATGEKLKPFVIGNSAYPRAFRENRVDINNLPVIWKSNQKAWMTSIYFTEWAKIVNIKMKLAGRKIIIFVDNASSHKCSMSFSNVKIEFLPPNLTSEVQPLDQGIIQNVKLNYRKLMLQHIVSKLETGIERTNFIKSISVYHAVRWIAAAWNEVSSTTILKCFKRAGFAQELNNDGLEADGNVRSASDVLGPIIEALPAELREDICSAQEIVGCDDHLQVHEESLSSPDAILESVLAGSSSRNVRSDDSDSEDSSLENVTSVPSYEEAQLHLKEFMKFASVHLPQCMSDLYNVNIEYEKELFSHKCPVQSKISNFFKPV